MPGSRMAAALPAEFKPGRKGTIWISFLLSAQALWGKQPWRRDSSGITGGVFLEQNMVPEFMIPDDAEDPGLFEEGIKIRKDTPVYFVPGTWAEPGI